MTFPTTLDTITTAGAKLGTPAHLHSTIHADLKTAVEALEAKVGIDSSAVATSLDYLVRQRVSIASVLASSSTNLVAARVVADTQDRLVLRPDGVQFGSGAIAPDVILGRSAAAVLAVTGAVTTTGDVSAKLAAAAQVKIGAFGPASEAAVMFGSAADALAWYRTGASAIRTPCAVTFDSTVATTGLISATGAIRVGNGSTLGGTLWSGSGAPAGALGAIGDFYFRTDGGAGTTFYLKTGASTWTGRA